jgi:hypothetical protein
VPDAEAWEFWRAVGERVEVDHSPWQAFLDAHLVKGADGINRVRYKAMDAAARQELKNYVRSLAVIDPRTLTRAAQLAYWINLYNALTVDVVLDYPRKKSILRMGRKLLALGPWDDILVGIAGQKLTLNDIEHRILRPLYGDERVHFAVNCASLSCPDLAMTAYTAHNLERLLDEQMQVYLHHPRGLRQTKDGFGLSSIFDWYQVDFGKDEKDLREWLAVRRPDLAPALRDSRNRIDYAYDWQLNDVRQTPNDQSR